MNTVRYGVLVVEDEPLILENIIQKIEKLPLPLKVVGKARDGRSALEQAKVLHPKVIITDIQMPGMDGLELCAHIRQFAPDTKIVILSGYGEFSYAQKAISYGVSEYLLKPIKVPQLFEAMSKICMDLSKNTQVSPQQMLTQALQGNSVDLSPILSPNAGIYLLCAGNSFHSYADVTVPQLEAWWQKAPENLLFESAGGQASQWLLPGRLTNERILITREFSPHFAQQLSSHIKRSMPQTIPCTICALRCAVKPEDIILTAQRLYNMLTQRLIPCQSQLLFLEDGVTEDFAAVHPSLILPVIHAIQNGDSDAVSSALQVCLQKLRHNNATQQALEHMVQILTAYSPSVQGEHATSAADFQKELYRLIAMTSDAKALYQLLYDNLSALVFPADCDSSEELASCVREFLDINFREKISVESVSKTFHFSTSHISKTFRAAYGVSPMKYLLNLRIEEAKRLIATGSTNIGLISEMVGYSDQRYFSRIFRNSTGLTPSEYRDSIQTAPEDARPDMK